MLPETNPVLVGLPVEAKEKAKNNKQMTTTTALTWTEWLLTLALAPVWLSMAVVGNAGVH